MNQQADLVDVDWAAFDPWRVQPVRHRLMAHPLLQMDALLALGQRLEQRHSVRTHSNQVAAGTPFNHAPRLHPNSAGVTATLSDIANASAWMSLLNVQADPIYRGLVDEVLDGIAPEIARRDPGMCYRGGWIFITSPHTTTPFHFDTEHGLILQVRGRKTLYVWEPTDKVAASDEARDLFHATHSRDLLRWDESLRARARVFHLEPGDGAYVPSTSPHLVETRDEPSVTISLTFYTDSTRRKATLHRMHQRLRDRGIPLPPVGANPVLDSVLHAGTHSLLAVKQLLRRAAGKPVLADNSPYAHASRN